MDKDYLDREQFESASKDKATIDYGSLHTALAYALTLKDFTRVVEIKDPALLVGQALEVGMTRS